LKAANLSRSTFYYHLKQIKQPDKNAELKATIKEIFHESRGRYGYRRITMKLNQLGYVVNHKKVQRLMRESGIICQVRMKKYRSYKGEAGKTAPNLLKRDFSAKKINEKWLTDITQFSLFGQKLYLSPILDCFSLEIVSYSLTTSPNLGQIAEMLEKAFSKYDSLEGLIMHSDQGWQYQHHSYRRALKENGITQSMSRKGNCYDNALMENFFGLLKSELLYLQDFDDIDHFIHELYHYIRWYNEDRIKLKLKGMSPIQFRVHSLLAS